MEKYRKILKNKQKQKQNDYVKKTALTVALSAVAGALSALFLAPKSDEINKSLVKTKDTIIDKVNTSIDLGKKKIKSVVDTVEKKAEKTEEKTSEIKENLKENLKEVKESLKETKDDIKEDIKK